VIGSNASRSAATSGVGAWGRLTYWYEPVLVFVLAVAARIPHLDHVPHKDELNHVLAARALLERGTLEIVAGAVPYDRAWGFTYLVAGIFRVFGESLVAARMPALIAGALLASALFLWVRSEVGRLGGWIAALLMVVSPLALVLSQWVRFYTIHALLFFLACILVYQAFSSARVPLRTRGWLIAMAVACLALALHLQILTVIGIAGLGLWAVLVGLPEGFARVPSRRGRWWLAGSLTALGLVAIAALAAFGFFGWLRAMAGHVDLWAMDRVPRYYHYLLHDRYPTLWALLPLALVIAAAARWRAALLCACVFGVAFVAHSLAAWRDERYLFYVLPMFFAAWGMAIGAATPWVADRAGLAVRTAAGRRLPVRAEKSLVVMALVAIAVFAALGNPATTSYPVKMLVRGDAGSSVWDRFRQDSDWVAAGAALAPEVAQTDVIVASYDITAVYALNRLDYLLGRFGSARGDRPDFSIKGKTAAPVVSTPQALAAVMACHRTGLVFIERTHFGAPYRVTPRLARYLEANAEKVHLPEEWRLVVFRWVTPTPPVDDSCPTLPSPPG
jgi:4-amino-4-deoxy-L-arabinose transferase-like glycosyltransferase